MSAADAHRQGDSLDDQSDDDRTVPRAGRPLRVRIPGFSSLQDDVLGLGSDVPVIDAAVLNERRDRISAAALPLLSAAIGVMLLLSSFFRLQPLTTTAGLLGAGLTGLTGAGLVVTAVVLSRRPVVSVHATALAILLIGTLVLCIAMLAAQELAHTAYIELMLVVAGPVLLRPGWYVVGLLSIWSLWFGVAAALSGTTDAAGWLLAMLAATVVSVVLHTMRTDSLRALGSALLSAEAQAVRDPATGLLNRRGLAVVGDEVLALARRSREPVSCTFVDIDGLKRVNDSQGHDAGDAVIMAVAEALSAVFREADVVSRWGGDEFVVLALGAGPRVEDLERRLIAHLSSSSVAIDGQWDPVVSCGRIVHMPWQEEDLDEITDRADDEMYRRRRLRRARLADDEGAR